MLSAAKHLSAHRERPFAKLLTKSQTTGILVSTKENTAKNGTSIFCSPTESRESVQRGSKQKRNPPASLRDKRQRSSPLTGSLEAASTHSLAIQ
jgi:hypothetical protein